MRATLTGLALSGAVSLFCYQSAYAVPADAAVTTRVPLGTASSSATGNSSWDGPSAATSIAGGGSHVQSGDVCFGSKADIALGLYDVRFTPKSGHW
jgi:hypothetical protein